MFNKRNIGLGLLLCLIVILECSHAQKQEDSDPNNKAAGSTNRENTEFDRTVNLRSFSVDHALLKVEKKLGDARKYLKRTGEREIQIKVETGSGKKVYPAVREYLAKHHYSSDWNQNEGYFTVNVVIKETDKDEF
ncbi:uncharacterized protein LOC131940938 [Physella acuta]|uniref:uncharacterized protein LOC131940938 n=1 Tax=Physella acuta TaxID=109671 RepID=UPI0027DBF7BB|nr:uncharacterized protein LOC131940938 [Physella acuta]